MKKKIIALVLTLTVLVAAFAACGKEKAPDTSESTNENVISTLESTDKATSAFFAAFESETIDGKKVTDEIFKGNKVTMVNVWGTFCAPCINEMPDLQKLSEAYESKGLKLVGIVADTYDYTKGENRADKISDAEKIISQTGVKYINILPSASLNAVKLDTIFSFPTTYFLNEKGEIIGSEYVGSRSYDEWSRIIDSVLERV